MGSNNPPSRSRKVLREIKKLARVKLDRGDAAAITVLRQKLLENGYTPIPTRDKRTLFKGWNELNPDSREIASWINSRAGMAVHTATGLLITASLLTLDNDTPDPDIAREIRLSQQQIAPALFEANGALERGRDDGSPKFMLFCRRAVGSEPFTIRSHKWSADPDDEDAPTFMIEIFASDRNREGRVTRQVGAFGPHTVDDTTGAVKIRYAWKGPSPAEVPLTRLPVLADDEAMAIVTEADRIFESRGLKQLKEYRGGRCETQSVYDLDDSMRFNGDDFFGVTLEELAEIYWQNHAAGGDTRCSGAFTGEGGTRKDRCQVGWSGSESGGHITIHDYATEITHRPLAEKPVTPESLTQSLREVTEVFRGVPSFADRFNAAIGEVAAGVLTEHAFANALAKLYGERLCYVPAERRWLRFDTPRWVDETGQRIESMVVGTFCQAVPLPRTPAGGKVRKQLEAHRHYAAIEKLLRGLLEYKDGFDKNPYLAASPSFVIDLKTGEARAGRPEDRLRLGWAYDPSPEEDCPRWKRFIDEVTSGDREIARFLQQWAGLSLCGDPSHQRLAFLSGTGRNGKNTYIDTLVAITGGARGGYSFATRFETFMTMRYAEHSTEIWALKGKRMVTASEVPDGAVWNVQRIKDLTGNATITARGMRQDLETFDRTWTLTMLGNVRPKLRNVDPAIRARVRIIPFDRDFEAEGLIDTELPKILLTEAAGILRWAINGLLDAKANGIIEPARVVAETTAYFRKHDVRERFIDERLVVRKGSEEATPLADVYREWEIFAKENDVDPLNQRSLALWLVKFTGATIGKITTRQGNNRATIIGIRLKPMFGGDSDDDSDRGEE